MKNIWDDRYRQAEYVYGTEPNAFMAEYLQNKTPGTIIFPAEGEGRNSVYAASLGWNVLAFDSSEIGKYKAVELANQKGVTVDYTIQDALEAQYPAESADMVSFIYAHFPPFIRREIHKHAITWLKPGGTILLEAFNPEQLQLSSGGPKELTMLYTKEMLMEDFNELEIEMLELANTTLNEGPLHAGEAAVIRFIGNKK